MKLFYKSGNDYSELKIERETLIASEHRKPGFIPRVYFSSGVLDARKIYEDEKEAERVGAILLMLNVGGRLS